MNSVGHFSVDLRNLIRTFALVALALSTARAATVEKMSAEESAIVALALQGKWTNGEYAVVSPDTALGVSKADQQQKDYIAKGLPTNGLPLGKLIDLLFERNQKTVRLSIPSDVKHGYIIDYDRKYEKYFDKDGDGWRAWHKEKPKAVCSTQVSRPAYDKKSGLVLLYMGNQADALAGAGFVLLYKYENGRLKELGRVEVWIS